MILEGFISKRLLCEFFYLYDDDEESHGAKNEGGKTEIRVPVHIRTRYGDDKKSRLLVGRGRCANSMMDARF